MHLAVGARPLQDFGRKPEIYGVNLTTIEGFEAVETAEGINTWFVWMARVVGDGAVSMAMQSTDHTPSLVLAELDWDSLTHGVHLRKSKWAQSAHGPACQSISHRLTCEESGP